MGVSVQKEGYRTVERTANFEFADFTQYNYYDHDKDNPVVFHLRKLPAFEPIYIFNAGSRNNPVGSKITLNPRLGGTVPGEKPEGMWIQFIPGPDNSPDRNQYDVVLGAAPGGGVILVTGDADDNAPVYGYLSPLDTKTTVDYVGHRFNNDLKVFFKDGAGHYGSVHFDIGLPGHDLTMSYQIKYNPGGGRSLAAQQGSQFQINK